jgi:hypothetical protein
VPRFGNYTWITANPKVTNEPIELFHVNRQKAACNTPDHRPTMPQPRPQHAKTRQYLAIQRPNLPVFAFSDHIKPHTFAIFNRNLRSTWLSKPAFALKNTACN